MNYKAPGNIPASKTAVKYLAPGDVDQVGVAGAGSGAEQSNVFPSGIIVRGMIQTDDIDVKANAYVSSLTVNDGASIGGDLNLGEDTKINHGTKFRTRIDGTRMIRERSADGGVTWVIEDQIGA
jgi:hypothetical protein